MYGMVNNAVRDMVLAKFGSETWEKIYTQADAPSEYGKMSPYDDDVTYRLVAAASQILEMPAEDVMHAFGEYWVLVTATEGYGPLLNLWGSTFVEFVSKLDDLHRRISETFTHLQPPSFQVEHVDDSVIRVHYKSHRPGLAPFVIGLLSGVGKRFSTEIEAKLEKSRQDGHTHDVFLVRYRRQ